MPLKPRNCKRFQQLAIDGRHGHYLTFARSDTHESELSQYYPGDEFVIRTLNNSDSNRYIERLELNGAPIQRSYLRHSEIVAGGELVLYMSDEAQDSYARSPDAPSACARSN